jgi:hypothetical protein
MRISGPNFFGFSDITTQQALAMSLYNEQELQQALQVGRDGCWGPGLGCWPSGALAACGGAGSPAGWLDVDPAEPDAMAASASGACAPALSAPGRDQLTMRAACCA